jgi:hypothetical protein
MTSKKRMSFGMYLAIGAALFAIAGCETPMPDNTPSTGGTPVVASEVVGHWFKLIGQGEPVIEVRPSAVQAIIDQVAGELLSQIPELTANNPLYIHVADLLDKGAVADVGQGVYAMIEIPEAQQVAPEEQANGSLLFEGDNLMSFINEAMGAASTVPTDLGGFDTAGISITNAVIKLWLFRVSGSQDLHFRISAEAAVEVPVVGAIQARVTLDGTGYQSQGPDADGLEEGQFSGF